MSFEVHPQLAGDTRHVVSLELCELLLMNDSRFPWCILVPRLPDLRELHEVPTAAQPQLWQEIDTVSRALQEQTNAHKMNVAALGNMVPQLHIHHIARYESDDAWPRPVWGAHPAMPYSETQSAEALTRLRAELGS